MSSASNSNDNGPDQQPVSPSRSQPRRTVSRTSTQWSVADTPTHHHQGTSYFPTTPPSATTRQQPHPILVRSTSVSSTKRGHRSTSISSSVPTQRSAREETRSLLSEEEDDRDDYEDEDGDRPTDLRSDHGAGKAISIHAEDDEESPSEQEVDPITLKDRQSLINVEHPFGLPIWKPALYKKSRSVTRYAEQALHSVPSAQAERHLLPGNIFWVVCFGWWLAIACFLVSFVLRCIPKGGKRYSSLAFGLGWYLAWPFGKYVEGLASEEDISNDDEEADEDDEDDDSIAPSSPLGRERTVSEGSDTNTVRGVPLPRNTSSTDTITPNHIQSISWSSVTIPGESTSLLARINEASSLRPPPVKSYGALPFTRSPSQSISRSLSQSQIDLEASKTALSSDFMGKACFWLLFFCIIAPLMLIACTICWALIVTIPMARLNWALIKHLLEQPTSLRFCAAPPASVVVTPSQSNGPNDEGQDEAVDGEPVVPSASQISIKHHRLAIGQAPPYTQSTSHKHVVLLCTYRAVGLQYYKYTVGGVNIIFVNLLPLVFFVIFDGFVLLPMIEHKEKLGKHIPGLVLFLTSRGLIFLLSLLSVIPLSYFIGMAVASISAQSSIGMGAVINATFGSLIEIILYSFALTQGKGHLVEGSIVGSLLAGVLLMPGLSMVSGALRKKEQKFNAKSAGVTSMMLIMAIIGTLTPTLFYQTYGNFQLICTGCPESTDGGTSPMEKPWICQHCYYEHPDPVGDPFYQSTVKSLMYFCASILLFSYLVGLWFSLRTHATQIWQNPQQLLHSSLELPMHQAAGPGSRPLSLYHRIASVNAIPKLRKTPSSIHPQAYGHGQGHHHTTSHATNASHGSSISPNTATTGTSVQPPASPSVARRVSYAPSASVYTPVLESVKNTTATLQHESLLPTPHPAASCASDATAAGDRLTLSTDEFTRAVAVATVSALRHQQAQQHQAGMGSRVSGLEPVGGDHGGGGHDGPAWSRTTSASVLLACTALYALIAEILVDVVDVILEGSGIDEKFLGVTLFALVPNTTEFMNAISFAMNGNISLSMEIGSAYALQVCLLQIPAMVAFSAWYAPEKMGEVANTFTLIFPRWDVIVIILSMFLMTYTYIEAKSNYHRGSILALSYLVLTAGFYYAPHGGEGIESIAERSPFSVFGDITLVPVTLYQSFWYWAKTSRWF